MSDLISRQAAIDAINKAFERVFVWDGTSPLGDKVLENVPSARPERKTGRWVERNPQNSPDCRLIECSECGNAYIVGYNIDYDDWIDGRNFCMKCGAKMNKEEGNDTGTER